MTEIARQIEKTVLLVHRFNGGTLSELNLNYRLLEPVLCLRPADLIQVMLAVEQAYSFSFRTLTVPLRTWGDLVSHLEMMTHG